ncbi:MAG: hypothetical protein DRI73_02390 [Bacteroidetes bacterium]|nr:MAG: hypothetical protein DRI73_02390 [Bacteroidota bacterium]
MARTNSIERDKNSIIVNLEIHFFKEGDYVVAYCPALELSSFGDDEEEAKEAFEEVLNIYMEETDNRRSLERNLLSLGWTLQKIPDANYIPSPSIIKKRLKSFPGIQLNVMTESIAIPI